MNHPLPWSLVTTGDDYILTDANGELIYIGPDAGEVLQLYRDAQDHALS